MTTDPQVPQEQALAPLDVSPETQEMVRREMPEATEQAKNETMALIEAIKRKAQLQAQQMQAEAEKASEITVEKYLEAIRTARREVEQMDLFDPERIEYSIKLMQMDAEQNWENLVKEISTLGDRLNDAAKAAWEALTAPRPDYSDTIDESKQL
ncbi:MAG: hypothetical protein SAL07_23395 [Oscillatoria sp. PMC 1051.18]|nr:hypothetical protein [Oscillatoria sp. PMC 1051.18]